MVEKSEIHRRFSLRLKNYDYSQPGAYFLTLVAHRRQNIYGEIQDGEIIPSTYGKVVLKVWEDLPRHFHAVCLDEFCLMPNHIYGLVILMDESKGNLKPPNLFEIIQAFKSFSTRRINLIRRTPGIIIWQRNYYEHIIRDEAELTRARTYIRENPLKWALDDENAELQK